MIGSGAVSNQVADVAEADTIIVIGANPTVNHPVAATFIKNAAKAGKNLIVLDPRKNDLARHATHYLQFKPDTDVALLNAIMKSIIDQNLIDKRQNVEKIISNLFKYFYKSPNKLPDDWRSINEPIERVICDYISGMTDRYASRLHKDLYE